MINKFQQGGKQDKEAIMQFVQGIAQVLKAEPQQIVQAAQQNPDALKTAVQVFQQTQDIQQAAKAFAEELQKKTQAARHGAKLNYLKSLKHQCAEDEEVYYYKKGGKAGCGCRKKEDGGELVKDSTKTSKAVEAFKKRKQGIKKVQTDFSKDEEQYFKGMNPSNAGEERFKKQAPLPPNKKPKSTTEINKKACGSKLKKHFKGGSLNRIPFLAKVLGKTE